MTGNNKFWRASLAGLASVAMLATMGVAASTANAAAATVAPYNFTVTLHANSPEGIKTKAAVDSYTDTDAAGDTVKVDFYQLDANHNGKLDELYSTSLWDLVIPTPFDWKFTGWYTGADYGTDKFDFNDTTVTKNIDLYAHWAEPDQTVKLDFKNTSQVFDNTKSAYYGARTATFASYAGNDYQLTVASGDKVADWELPADYAGDGYVIDTWNAGDAASTSATANDKVTLNDLTSKYAGKLTYGDHGPYTVNLFPQVPAAQNASIVKYTSKNNSSPLAEIDVKYGEAVPTSPRLSGNKLVTSWTHTDPATGAEVEWKEGDTASDAYKTLTLHAAGSTTETFKVTYVTEVNGASTATDVWTTVATEYVAKGASPKGAVTPSRDDNYTFAGWSETPGYNQKTVDLSSLKINADKTLYAQWTVNNVKVTFDYNYASKIDKQSYAAGQEFTVPAPTRDGYTLIGWYTGGNNTNGNPFSSGVVFTKQFRNVTYKVNDQDTKTVKEVQWLDLGNWGNFDSGENANPATRGWLKDVVKDVIPANAKLRINDNGELQYQKVTTVKLPTGDKTTTSWETVPDTLYAAWGVSDGDALSKDESAAPSIKDESGDYLGDQADFVNYPAYVEKMKAYYAHKEQLAQGGLTEDEAATLSAELKAAVDSLQEKTNTPVYRLYNPYNHGDHLYTSSLKEYEDLQKLGWKGESVQFNVLSGNKYGLSTAVYRVFNPYNGEHLLTTGSDEVANLVKAGWLADNDGNPVFYAPQGGDVAVTRLFNPYETVGTHLYLTNQDEVTSNVKLGWVEEEPVFYTR